MWCYRGGGGKPCIVYEYQETRAGFHAAEFLKGFKGYLESDAYSGYNWTAAIPEITAVGCHAHARRPFAELRKLGNNGLANDALKFYSKLYAVEKEAREKQLSHVDRYEIRQQKALPVLNAFKTWLDHSLPKTPEQSKIGKALRYCLTHWPSLINYLKDGRLEIDNNLVENAIRPFALGRKNWLLAGSPSGAKAGATLFSLIETCKTNGIEPYQYFCTMLHQLRQCVTDDDYHKLLPHNIKLGLL